MSIYAVPAVYDSVQRKVRPACPNEVISPSYLCYEQSPCASPCPPVSSPCASQVTDNCKVVSKDEYNLITCGSDSGVYLNAEGILSSDPYNLLHVDGSDHKVTLTKADISNAGFVNEEFVVSLVANYMSDLTNAQEQACACAVRAEQAAERAERAAASAEAVSHGVSQYAQQAKDAAAAAAQSAEAAAASAQSAQASREYIEQLLAGVDIQDIWWIICDCACAQAAADIANSRAIFDARGSSDVYTTLNTLQARIAALEANGTGGINAWALCESACAQAAANTANSIMLLDEKYGA